MKNQQRRDNGADSGSENSLFAELRDIKYSLTVLKKQVDDIKFLIEISTKSRKYWQRRTYETEREV